MKIALFQSDNDSLNVQVPATIELDGFTRVSEWMDVKFCPRDEEEIKEEKIQKILESIKKSDKKLANQLAELRGLK